MKTDTRGHGVLSAGFALVLLAASCGGERSPAAASPTVPPETPAATATRTLAATASPPAVPSSTPAPQPTPTEAATAVSASPTSAQQAGVAAPAPLPTLLPRASAVSLTFRAANLAFDQSTARVPVGATVTATLQNDDEGVEHNVSFSLAGLAHGETCKGPCTRTQSFTAAEAGSYYFLCTLHDMVGTFIVEP